MAKAPKILNYKNLAYEKYEFGQPFKQPSGIYQSMCSYRLSKNETLPFYFETPKLKTVSGIVKLDSKYYMDLELPQTGDATSFYNYLLRTDEHNITMCHQNSKDWFNQYMPLDVVEGFYKSSVILRPNGQLPVIRVRLPSYKGNILTEIYNIKKEKINDVLCIAEGDYIVGIIEFSGLAFMSQSFYPVFELQKIKIFKENEHRTLPTGYIFSDFNEKVDLDKITIPVEEERILKEPPINTISYAPTAPTAPTAPIVSTTIKQESIQKQLSTPVSTASLNENIEQILKVKEPADGQVISTVSTVQNKFGVNINTAVEKGQITLFDIVRNNTLKSALLDDNLFIQHSRGIAAAYQHREANLRKYLDQKTKPSNTSSNTSSNGIITDKEKSVNIEIPTNQVSIQTIPHDNKTEDMLENNEEGNKLDVESSISVKDSIQKQVEKENSENIEAHPINIPIGNNISDILERNAYSDNYITEEVYNDNYDNDENNENNEDNYNTEEVYNEDTEDDEDSDDGIDYKILDDLEVVVFED